MKKKVAIAGAGVAGLSAAVFLAEKGFEVTLLESSPRAGGRASSFFDKERQLFFDNGQHLLAGWYENTFRFLKLVGSFEKLKFQDRLDIEYFTRERLRYRLKSSDMKPPFNLLIGLMSFAGFTVRERLKLLNLKQLLNSDDPDNYRTAEEHLDSLGHHGNIRKYFWDPFVLAVFNTTPANVSGRIFRRVLQKGIEDNEGFRLVIPDTDLNEIFSRPAEQYLCERNFPVRFGKRILSAELGVEMNAFVTADNERIEADYFISALPFYSFDGVFGSMLRDAGGNDLNMRTSSIVSVHLFIREKAMPQILKNDSTAVKGLIGTVPQWLFVKSDSHLSLVISCADELGISEKSAEEIADVCIRDLESCIEGFSGDIVTGYKVIKEKRATFIPDNLSETMRPGQRTRFRNFFIAGDWTNTELPSTIESAVMSSAICTRYICEAEGV